jgi:hypothetical protein
MGFTDLVSDAGLTSMFYTSNTRHLQVPVILTFATVLNNWLRTRSYVVRYVHTPQDLSQASHTFLLHDEEHWSVFMRRLKTPLYDYYQSVSRISDCYSCFVPVNQASHRVVANAATATHPPKPMSRPSKLSRANPPQKSIHMPTAGTSTSPALSPSSHRCQVTHPRNTPPTAQRFQSCQSPPRHQRRRQKMTMTMLTCSALMTRKRMLRLRESEKSVWLSTTRRRLARPSQRLSLLLR